MTTLKPETTPRLFKSAQAFEAWLKKHHAASDGLWLQVAKKGAEEPSVTYAEAVDLALCFGWIDGQKKGLDEQHFLQRFTPRRPKSVWSKINIAKVATLIETGRMQPAGQAQVDAAKADGRWARAYDGARTSTVPDDLQEALDATPAAKEFFATINATNRYAVLWQTGHCQAIGRSNVCYSAIERRNRPLAETRARQSSRSTLHPDIGGGATPAG